MLEWLVVFGLGLLVLSFRLFSFPLLNWDEAWYAEIIKNMTTGGHGYWLPFWNGQYFYDKPPLYFWLSLPLVKMFGLGEWQVRIVGVVASALALSFIYLIGKKLAGRKAGILATLMLVSINTVAFRLAGLDIDGLQLSFFCLSFYAFLESEKKPWLLISGISLGLATLTKSWLLGLAPLGLAVWYGLICEPKLLKNLWGIFLVGLVTSAWWYLGGVLIYKQPFLDWYILSPGDANFSTKSLTLSSNYLRTLIADIGFWLIPWSFSLGKLKKQQFVFISAALLYFVVLNLARDQFGWYLIPCFALLAIAFGTNLAQIDFKKEKFVLVAILLAFCLQCGLAIYSYKNDPDKSLVSAQLGLMARSKIKPGERVVLVNPDFPAFIYYSNLGQVTVAENNGGKTNEYWIIKNEEVKNLSKPYWLVNQGKFIYVR